MNVYNIEFPKSSVFCALPPYPTKQQSLSNKLSNLEKNWPASPAPAACYLTVCLTARSSRQQLCLPKLKQLFWRHSFSSLHFSEAIWGQLKTSQWHTHRSYSGWNKFLVQILCCWKLDGSERTLFLIYIYTYMHDDLSLMP